MILHLQQHIKRTAQQFVFPVTWVAGVAAMLFPAAQGSAQAQVVPTTTDGAGTTVSENSGQYDIDGGTQAGANLFHKFDEFSLSENEIANFTSDSSVFNIVGQVSTANPSYIDGTVQVSGSDANLYLVNPSGVLFGENAQLSLQGSFTATTADQLEFNDQWLNVLQQDADYSAFTANPSKFRFTESEASAVVNQGDLTVEAGESIVLMGGNVVSTGSLTAPGGEVGLVSVGGNHTVSLAIPGSLLSLEIAEDSLPLPASGFVPIDLPTLLTGSPISVVDDLVVTSDGDAELRSFRAEDREVLVNGEISTYSATTDGGTISLIGDSVDVLDGHLNASGENGGTIRIGGGQGTQGRLYDADLILLTQNSTVRADGLSGAGGDVYAGAARLNNLISAQFSATGTTKGGLIETSADYLDVNGVDIDVTGQTEGGEWLIDPVDIEIVLGAAGVNQIDPADIVTQLDAGTDVSIVTSAGPSGDITLTDSIFQSGGGRADLTLTSRRFNAVSGAEIDLTSTGALTFNLNAVNTEAVTDASSIERAITAIGSAAGDRTINLSPATYNVDNVITIDTDVAIKGEPSSALSTLLQATDSNRIFQVSSNTTADLQNLTLTRASNTSSGGGINNDGGTLNIDSSRFVDNIARSGGAIRNIAGELNISNSEFLRNEATLFSGGAVSAVSNSVVNISTGTRFSDNTALDDGGAIQAYASAVAIQDADFLGNRSIDDGGAIALQDGSLSITRANFDNNSAQDGGALTTWNRAVTDIADTTFTNNIASESGGGLYITDSTVSFVNSKIGTLTTDGFTTAPSGNQARDSGGLFAYNSSLTFDNTAISYNQAAAGGGGLVLDGGSVDLLNGSSVSYNQATTEGGGIYIREGNVSLQNAVVDGNTADVGGGLFSTEGTAANTISVQQTDFVDNVAQQSGGALYIRDETAVSLTSNNFTNNRAAVGGALSIQTPTASDVGSTFVGNQASNPADSNSGVGGAIYIGNQGGLQADGSTFTGNNAAVDGGAIAIYRNQNTALNNITVTNNTAADDAGGILIWGGASVDITHSTFDANTAGVDAGAVRVIDSTLQLLGNQFVNNSAGEDGGALYAANSTLTISNSDTSGTFFGENDAVTNGGGVFVRDGSTDIKNATFEQNTARVGGGLFNQSNTLDITDSTFTRNDAVRDGGGLYAVSSEVAIANSTFTSNNVTTNDGGGIAVDESTLNVSNTNFRNNATGLYSLSSSADGGAIAIENNSSATITGGQFSANTAHDDGGGLYISSGSEATVEGSTFVGNRTIDSGGGLYASGSAQLSLNNVEISRNRASRGGGMRVRGASVTLSETTLEANHSDTFGGGIIVAEGSIALSDVALTNNSAAQQGGGLTISSDSTATISRSLFDSNQSGVDGGGLFNLGTTELVNTTFSGNRAANQGGAIVTEGASANLIVRNSTVTQNSAGESAGGIITTDASSTRVLNTIVAANQGSNAADMSGQFTDEGNNLIGQANGADGFGRSEWVGSDRNPITPNLAPLANNGGITQTHRPLANSAAINAGRAENLSPVDQRGLPRFSGSAVDIGAVELSEQELPTITLVEAIQETTDLLAPTLSSSDIPKSGSVVLTQGRQSLSQDDVSVQKIETSLSQGFEDYWDISAGPDLTFSEVQAILRRAQEERAVNSAVIYAIFSSPEPEEDETTNILQIEPTPSGDDLLNLSVVMPEGELVSYQLPVTRREASRQVRLLRSTVSDPDDFGGHRPFTQQLYQWLLAPLEKDLAAQNIHNLMYALDAGLRTAPITAMRDYEGYSLERYGISVVPSMGLMQADFSPPVRRSAVAMGVAEFTDQPPLPAVPIELDVLEDLVPASEAILNENTTLAALTSLQSLEQPGLLHLATHASFDNRSAESSLIHLWNEDLSMKDFSQLGWDDADLELLILSACSTALSGRNSELGFAGLAAAAGVDATVGSLWEVSDVGTLALMSEFYAQLEARSLRGEALRQAQLALLNGETRIENGKLLTSHGEIDLPSEWNLPSSVSLDHPFFWSAFTMVGNPW